MATEVENNVPAATDTKEIKEEAPADNKAEEASKPEAAGDAPAVTKEPAPPKVLAHKANFEKDIVYLYQFSRTPLLPSLSPYCLKVETWLRLAGLKYEVSSLRFLISPRRCTKNCIFAFWGCCPLPARSGFPLLAFRGSHFKMCRFEHSRIFC